MNYYCNFCGTRCAPQTIQCDGCHVAPIFPVREIKVFVVKHESGRIARVCSNRETATALIDALLKTCDGWSIQVFDLMFQYGE